MSMSHNRFGETQKDVCRRLKGTPSWGAYLGCRDQLKAEGVPAGVAWIQASNEFPLEDEDVGSPARPSVVPGDDPSSPSSAHRIADCVLDRSVLEMLSQKRGGNMKDAILWVSQWMEMPPDMIPWEEAPGPEALSLMELARTSGTKRDFHLMYGSKMVPTRAELDRQEAFEDDGREVIGLIDRIRAASENAKAETQTGADSENGAVA